jgi:hypothetical protein
VLQKHHIVAVNDFIPSAPAKDFFQSFTAMPGNSPRRIGIISAKTARHFNAFGIAAGGGAGQALAQWVHDGMPPYDLWVVDIRRFGRPHDPDAPA